MDIDIKKFSWMSDVDFENLRTHVLGECYCVDLNDGATCPEIQLGCWLHLDKDIE